MKRNQHGFSAVEALLMLLIIAILGGIGYYVYQSQQETKKSQDNANKSSQEATDLEASNEEESAPPATSNYLEIKEWGVKIKLTGAENASYKIDNTAGETNQGEAYQATAQLRLKDGLSTDEACQRLGLSIYRSSSVFSMLKSKQVGSYHYAISGGTGECGNATADAIRTPLINQLKTPDGFEAL